LDQRLAARFEAAGGCLKLNSRKKANPASESIVHTHGRTPTRSDWIGLKLHCEGLRTEADLELHLGQNGYVGLSKIENDRINVCALFKQRPDLKAKRDNWLVEYLKHSGLDEVAERLSASRIFPESHCGVAGVEFSRIPSPKAKLLSLGDAYSVIPPFTGNGMSIALEAAELAYPILRDYAAGSMRWQACVEQIHATQRKTFDRRLRAARWLHPWMHTNRGQISLGLLARTGLLPFSLLYSLTD
jgi:flavin-dependent dehydrogenase